MASISACHAEDSVQCQAATSSAVRLSSSDPWAWSATPGKIPALLFDVAQISQLCCTHRGSANWSFGNSVLGAALSGRRGTSREAGAFWVVRRLFCKDSGQTHGGARSRPFGMLPSWRSVGSISRNRPSLHFLTETSDANGQWLIHGLAPSYGIIHMSSQRQKYKQLVELVRVRPARRASTWCTSYLNQEPFSTPGTPPGGRSANTGLSAICFWTSASRKARLMSPNFVVHW